MSLGNVARRNMSAEDNRIEIRLRLYDALTARYEELGFEEKESRARALNETMSCTRKQALTALENLTALAKGLR
jgi:hypothetical protein